MSIQQTAPQTTEFSLRDYFDVLRRRKLIFAQCFLLVLAVGIVANMLAKPVYRTSTRMMLEEKSYWIPSAGSSDSIAGIFTNTPGWDVLTQIEFMQSHGMMQECMQAAELSYMKPFLPVKRDAKGKEKTPDRKLYTRQELAAASAMVRKQMSALAKDIPKLTARQSSQTTVVDVDVEAQDPDHALLFAQILPDVFRANLTRAQIGELDRAVEFARDRQKQEVERISALELNLQALRTRSKSFNTEDERKIRLEEQVASERELQQARRELDANRTRLASLTAQRRATPEFLERTTTITNPQIEATRSAIAELNTQKAGMLVLYKEESPEVQEVDAKIKAQERRLSATPPTITTTAKEVNVDRRALDSQIASMTSDIRVSELNVAQAQVRLREVTSTVAGTGMYSVKQSQVEGEVSRHRDLLVSISKSLEELSLRQNTKHDPVRLVQPPLKPILVAPKTVNNLTYAAIVGILIGFCAALLQEFLDDRINVPEDARRILGAPILGYVPLISDASARLITPDHNSSLLESFRVLRANVRFAGVDSAINSMLVCSTVPGEGKSVTASNLAIAMAIDGMSVILVDSDLRRPTIHQKFGIEQMPGLTGVLAGTATLDEALAPTAFEGLRLLPSGPTPPNPAELLNSRSMRDLHRELRDRADMVIFDSPPFLATADAQVLSADVDGVLYVVQFAEARKSAARHACELMNQAHARVLGLVLNKIDLNAGRSNYYYGYYHYYGYYVPAGAGGQIEGSKVRKKRRSRHQEFEEMMARTKKGDLAGQLPPGEAEGERKDQA